jgi:hypothetical protein
VIERWVWNCGSGFTAQTQGDPPAQALCRYQLPGTYTATLYVSDNGTGIFDPVTQRYVCQKSDQEVVSVVVTTTQQ